MADRVSEIAEGALKVLEQKNSYGSSRGNENARPDIGNSEVFDALFSGKKVLVSVNDLNCPKIEELRRDLTRFMGSVSGLRFEVAGGSEKCASNKAAIPSSSLSPEKQVLEEILADVISHEGSCIVEPGKACTGCKGRCSNLGF
jgi:hypothetical protein